jgi:hypothetical protein
VSLPRSRPVERCPIVQTSVLWPLPVDQRLNELVDRVAHAIGGEVSRSHLLAALVAATDADASALSHLLAKYRQLTAGDVVLQPGKIVVAARTPGRRPRLDRAYKR